MVREAEVKDREAIQNLYKVLCPDLPVSILPERINELKNDPNNFLFVYEEDNEVVGTVFITICLSPIFGFQPFAFLEYFIVEEKHRRKGIGSKLTDHVIQVCRDRKCTRIVLVSNDYRKEAHAFYESKGFSSSGKIGYIKYLNRK